MRSRDRYYREDADGADDWMTGIVSFNNCFARISKFERAVTISIKPNLSQGPIPLKRGRA